MGSGKTFWAKKLSAALNIPPFDLDDEIEKAAGKTIAEIFTEAGENNFRLMENEQLKTFGNKQNFILSTGGGAPCFHDNITWMNEQGVTIWIDEPPATIAQRLKKEKSHRPLIATVPDDELETFFTRMREKREPFYSKAKHHLTDCSAEADFLKLLSLYE